MPTESEIRDIVRTVVDRLAHQSSSPESPESSQKPPEAADSADGKPCIAIGGDHGGYRLKERLGFLLREAGYPIIDCGTDGPDAVDYPDFAHAVARKVVDGEATYGIVIDGAGIGSAMAANKVPGIRASACYDLSTARNSREHNHANVLTLGAGLSGDGLAWQITQEWLSTPWGPGRHANRVAKITGLENHYLKDGS